MAELAKPYFGAKDALFGAKDALFGAKDALFGRELLRARIDDRAQA